MRRMMMMSPVGLHLAASAASLIGAQIHQNEKRREEPEVDLRDVPGSRQRKRWLQRQARKRQRQVAR